MPGLVEDELPEVELLGLELRDEEVSVSDWVSVLLFELEPGVAGSELDELPAPEPILSDDEEPDEDGVSDEDEPELMVPDAPEVPREELAPEPEPEPMLPEVLSDGDERPPLDDEPDLPFCLDHFLNSDCDSAPLLSASAVVNAPLRSVLTAASVCEMRPSRLASSAENEMALPELPELIEPLLLLGLELLLELIEPLLLLGLELLLEPIEPLCGLLELPELLWPNAVAAITAIATALITGADFFMLSPRRFEG